MRRAIQQGRGLGLAPGFLVRYGELVRETMGAGYPELYSQREAIDTWLATEEEHFGHTLEQGLVALDELIERARDNGGSVSAEDAFRLHDTFGFPFELTRELVADAKLTVDEAGFDELMDEQRTRSRAGGASGAASGGASVREEAGRFAKSAEVKTHFVGYETTEQATMVTAVEPYDDPSAASSGTLLVKLADSPFYAVGGGQISDVGVIECADGDCRVRVADVVRLGDDQALLVQPEDGELRQGERVFARVEPATRHATECNHTTTHLLHAALRQRLGPHVRQAGSYVGPDKLRFDFSHGQALSADELRDVEDQLNAWILANHPVRAITTTLSEARSLGAMALFGEKYGEVVRMVEVGDGGFSRELCGGTHVRSTAEIGLARIISETSSAANVRRIEALSGPEAVRFVRERDRLVEDVAKQLRVAPLAVLDAVDAREAQRKQLELQLRKASAETAFDAAAVADTAINVADVPFVAAQVDVADAKALPEAADRVKGQLGGDGVIVLATTIDGRASVVVSVAPSIVARGVRAGEVVKAAAAVLGGGGGGRDTLAQAGGSDIDRLDDALAAAREAVTVALGG
jgi:alanyl-tRNA synthetase